MLPEGSLRDDAALLAVRQEPFSDPLKLSLRAHTEVLPMLRRVLRGWLETAGASPREVAEIALASSEACANAVEHAYAPSAGTVEFEASVSEGGTASVIVRDFGSWRPPRGRNRGRGMLLMEGLMDTVDVQRNGEGTTIRLSRSLEGREP
jgi:anti-sigma regulatory factor (Ser/Thr protein kinase)